MPKHASWGYTPGVCESTNGEGELVPSQGATSRLISLFEYY
jgi:hypothetical protein